MTTYRLDVSLRAESDADANYDWLAERSRDGAANWYRMMREALQAITKNPLSYSTAPEGELFKVDVRQALFKTRRGRPYRALFVVMSDTVHVLAIRGAGQDLATFDDLNLHH